MVDSRFRRRRVEIRRKEGRRRLWVLIGISALLAVGGGGWVATESALLDVDHVAVEGAIHTSPVDARMASGLRTGEPLLDLDGARAAQGVSSLPWVREATVVRRWSGRVSIRLIEREPLAVTGSIAGGAALIDGSGRVLEWVDVAPPGLAVLTGLPPAGPAGSLLAPEGLAVLAVAVALPAELRGRTAGVAPSAGGRGEVDLRLHPDGIVRIGPPEDLGRKFDAVRAVLAQVDVRTLNVLDVRRPDSPVLTRR